MLNNYTKTNLYNSCFLRMRTMKRRIFKLESKQNIRGARIHRFADRRYGIRYFLQIRILFSTILRIRIVSTARLRCLSFVRNF